MKTRMVITEKCLKKWKKQKKLIISKEHWTRKELMDYIYALYTVYQQKVSEYSSDAHFSEKETQEEFSNQINELLYCMQYCKELHLYHFLFPHDVKEQLPFIHYTINVYMHYVAYNHGAYLKQFILKQEVVDYSHELIEEVLHQTILDNPEKMNSKSNFETIQLLLDYLEKQRLHYSQQNPDQLVNVQKIKWQRSKIDLAVLVTSLAQLECFTCQSGKPLSTAQLAGYLEQVIDLEFKKDIHQTCNNVFRRKDPHTILDELSRSFEMKERK